jgi:hypothetical protein
VTALAVGLDKPAAACVSAEEMACETSVAVHTEMLIPFKMTVAGPASDFDAVDNLVDMLIVCEPDVTAPERLGRELIGGVTLRP